MGRGKRNVVLTQKIILSLMNNLPHKVVAQEHNCPLSVVQHTAARYFQVKKELTLNEKGVRVINEEQLNLPFGYPSTNGKK